MLEKNKKQVIDYSTIFSIALWYFRKVFNLLEDCRIMDDIFLSVFS